MNNSTNTKAARQQNKSKKGRFNFVDLILVVVLLLIIGILVYSFSPVSLIKKWTGSEKVDIQYEIEITNVDSNVIDLIKADAVVTDSVTKSEIGTVTMVNRTDYVEYQPYEVINHETDADENIKHKVDYTLEKVGYPNKYNLNVTVTVSADYSEGTGYTVGSTRIAVGEKLNIKFPDYICEGYCVGITTQY